MALSEIDPFGRQSALLSCNHRASASQIILRPQQNRRATEFRHSLNANATNSIINSSPILHFINENTSLHSVNSPPIRKNNNRCLSSSSTSAVNLKSQRNYSQNDLQPVKMNNNNSAQQHLSRRAIHNSTNQLRLSNKNYIWPRNHPNRSRSTSNRPPILDRTPNSMSTSICSFSPDQQRPNSSTKLELKEKPKTINRIVNSDLHLSLSGQTSMLMLTRKHEYVQGSKDLVKSMQNIADTKPPKSNKQIDFVIGDEEIKVGDDGAKNRLSDYPPGLPYKVSELEDCSLILEFFDPVLNDRRRAAKETFSRLLQQDSIGFRSIQQQLKSFESVSILKIGHRKTRTTLKSIQNLDKLYSQLILHNYHLQRPRKKSLEEFYKDQEESELDGWFF